jgi:zinc transporter ZupT
MNILEVALPVLAGAIGGLGGIYLRGKITGNVKILLAFSGAYLFGLTIMHLLPDIFTTIGRSAGYYILVGFLLQLAMDYFSKGVEHGHIHHHDQAGSVFPYGIYISLFLHSFLEGLPLSGGEAIAHHSHSHDALLMGIAIHKIPEAVALAAIMYHFFNSKSKVIWMIGLYCLATPLGLLAGELLLHSGLDNPEILYAQILAVAVGIFIHVSTTIIFEADEQHTLSRKRLIAILLGLGLVFLF